MLEREWVLEYPGVELAWGGVDLVSNPHRRSQGIYNREPPEQAEVNITSEDGDRPRQDGVSFGQDYRGGRTWTFQFGIRSRLRPNTAAELQAGAWLAELEAAWRGDGVRLIPGRMASLTTQRHGQERTIYGRPRKFTPNPAHLHVGEAVAVATFDSFDDVFYGPEQALRVDLAAPTSQGGVALPVAPPVALASSSVASLAVPVGGSLGAWMAVEVHGPIANPVVEVTNRWALRLNGSIPAGMWVTLDARPWQRSILRSDGISVAGDRNRAGAALSDAWLPPGSHEVRLSGVDLTSTAYVMLRWQNSHASLS